MAKTETTVKSYFYTVTSPNGGTVTDASGKLNKPVDAGDQLTVQAPSDSLTCDDDDAVILKANFKSPLLALRLLGRGVNALPPGYTQLAWLQGTGTQYINTGATGNETSEVLCTFERTSEANKGVYTQNTTASTGYLNCFVWGNAMEYLRYDWGPKTYYAKNAYPGGWVTSVQSAKGVTLNGEQILPAFESSTFTSAALVLFSNRANVGSFTADNVRMARWALKNGGKPVRDMVPALDLAGTPCMYDRVTRTAYKRGGSGQFIAGMTLSQVRGLRLPAGGGELTLSLPYEASVDQTAQAALERARANGWELTLQYAEAEVPAGYRRLEFLESTGTQYIDTGVKLSNESEVKCECLIPEGNVNTAYLYGSKDAYKVNDFSFYVNQNEEHGGFILGENAVQLKFTLGEKAKIIQSSLKFAINAQQKTINNTLVFETPRGCFLFCLNQVSYISARIYSFSISRAGEMQVDYVPCISPDGKLGMYNKVDGSLKENVGSGAFIAGLATVDDVRKLWLPETNGELTVSVPADTPDSAVEQLRKNNPTWQIAIQIRTDNEN